MGYKGKGNNPLAYMGIDQDLPEVIVKSTSPTTANKNFDPGDIWVNKTSKKAFIFASAVGGVGTWLDVSGESASIADDFISGILAVTTFGAAVATEGNRYIAQATAGTWTINRIYTYENGSWTELVPSEGAMGYNHDTNAFVYWTGAAWDALPSGVTTLAGLTDTTIAAPGAGAMLFYDGVNSWDNKAVSGHATAASTGAITVTGINTAAVLDDGGANPSTIVFTVQTVGTSALTIPDFASVADTFAFVTLAQTLANKTLTTPIIVTTGAIVDAGGNAYLTFVEDTTPRDSIQITQGDVGLGATIESITDDTNADLNLGAAGTGDIAFTNGTEMKAVRTTNNLLFTFTDQATAESTCVFPSQTNASDTVCLIAETQALTNKTLTVPLIVTTGYIADAGGDAYLTFVESATPRDSVQITQGDVTVGATIESITADTNADLNLAAAGTGDIALLNGTEMKFVRTTNNLLFTLTDQATAESTCIFPSQTNASDTVCLIAETQALTNKTIDANGTGNALSNINMAEMEAETIPAADGNNVTVTDGLIIAKVTNNATNFNIFSSNAPFAFIVIDAWSLSLSADGGTWKLNDTAAGAGTDITDVVTVAASDKNIDRITTIDDAAFAIPAAGDLSIVFDGGGVLDAYIFIRIARLA